MTDFKSPLAMTTVTEYTALAFGTPTVPSELLALRQDLQIRLQNTLNGLPPAMYQEAQAMVDGYSGEGHAFYGLFYQPVWSFLHWVVARSTTALAPAAMGDACTAQALGLFLHLWDDHLCDGQLATTPLSLQVRTDAWTAYTASARRLAQHMGLDRGWVDEHIATYLGAVHLPEPTRNVNDFCARFERQIAIWTLVPRLLGPAIGGAQAGEDLAQVLRAFSNAWRLMDDMQDVEDDVLAGVESAVWQVLDPPGRAAWAAAHRHSKPLGRLDAASWATLQSHLDKGGCIADLLVRTYTWLDIAAALAHKNDWPELATEILAHRPFTVGGAGA